MIALSWLLVKVGIALYLCLTLILGLSWYCWPTAAFGHKFSMADLMGKLKNKLKEILWVFWGARMS